MPNRYLILTVAVIVAAAFLALSGRYQIVADHFERAPVVYRVDRLTGQVEACLPYFGEMKDVEPATLQPGWCRAAINY